MCNNCTFQIYPPGEDPDAKAVGVINKLKMSGKKRKPDFEQVEVSFPGTASCQDKVLIISACLLVLSLVALPIAASIKSSRSDVASHFKI